MSTTNEPLSELALFYRDRLKRGIALDLCLPSDMITLDFLDGRSHWESELMLRSLVQQRPRLQHVIDEYRKALQVVDKTP